MLIKHNLWAAYQWHKSFKVDNVRNNFIYDSLQFSVVTLESSLVCHAEENISEEFVNNWRIEISSDVLRPEFHTRDVVRDVCYGVDSFPSLV